MAGAAVAAFVPAELCPDHFVAAGKLTQAELLARDLGHGSLLLAACPSPHAVTTTSGSFLGRLPNAHGTVRLWDPATGAPVGDPLRGHTSKVCSVAFGADTEHRRLLASGGYDKTVRLWDPTSPAPVGDPLRHTDWVCAVAFGVDGRGRWLLASASEDGTVRLWDPATGAAIVTLLRRTAPWQSPHRTPIWHRRSRGRDRYRTHGWNRIDRARAVQAAHDYGSEPHTSPSRPGQECPGPGRAGACNYRRGHSRVRRWRTGVAPVGEHGVVQQPVRPARFASARQPLWGIGGWVTLLDDQHTARAHAHAPFPAMSRACSWPPASTAGRPASPGLLRAAARMAQQVDAGRLAG